MGKILKIMPKGYPVDDFMAGCQYRDTDAVTANGSLLKFSEVSVGDQLMGPDGSPREVLAIHKKDEMLYRVSPIKGAPFEIGGSQVLSLQASFSDHGFTKSQVVNIPVDEYLMAPGWFIHLFKLWRTGVAFPTIPVPFPPYLVGLYLGDGSRESPAITTGDQDIEVIEYLEQYAKAEGLHINKQNHHGSKCFTRRFSAKNGAIVNPVCRLRDSLFATGDRRVPGVYLRNCRINRLALLAGLIDSDGYQNSNCFEIVCKNPHLAIDIARLSQSLGYCATLKKVKKGIKSLNFVGTYAKVMISGDLVDVPIRVERKKPKPRKQRKSVLRTGFTIEPIESWMISDFELGGDSLFLSGDFTVRHGMLKSNGE